MDCRISAALQHGNQGSDFSCHGCSSCTCTVNFAYNDTRRRGIRKVSLCPKSHYMYYIWMGLCSGHGHSVVIREVSLYPQSLLAKLTVVNCSSLKLLGRCLSLFIGANMSVGIIGSHISTMHTFLYLQQENANGQVCPVKFLQIPLSGTRFNESRAYVRCSDHACQTFLYSSCNSVHNLCTVLCVHAWANSIHAHCLSFLASIQVMPLHESLFDTTVYLN